MAGKSNYLADRYLNWHFRTGTGITPPSNVYVALFSTMPADDGTGGVELSGTGYARQAIAKADASWNAPSAGAGTTRVISNVSTVTFTASAGSDWAPSGTPCVGFGLFDASTSGNYLGGSTFVASKIIQSGDGVNFAAGALVVSED